MNRLNRIEVGALLRKLRERKGVAQDKIALEVGVNSINFISMIERGKNRLPLDKFPQYMQAYGATHQEQLVILKSLWPDVWEVVTHLEGVCGTLFREQSLESAYSVRLAGIGFGEAGTEATQSENAACV